MSLLRQMSPAELDRFEERVNREHEGPVSDLSSQDILDAEEVPRYLRLGERKFEEVRPRLPWTSLGTRSNIISRRLLLEWVGSERRDRGPTTAAPEASMTPHTSTGKKGWGTLMIDRAFPGVGRIQVATGTRDVTDLYEVHEVAAFLVEDADRMLAYQGRARQLAMRLA